MAAGSASGICKKNIECWYAGGDLTGAVHVLEFHLAPSPYASSIAAAKFALV